MLGFELHRRRSRMTAEVDLTNLLSKCATIPLYVRSCNEIGRDPHFPDRFLGLDLSKRVWNGWTVQSRNDSTKQRICHPEQRRL